MAKKRLAEVSDGWLLPVLTPISKRHVKYNAVNEV